MSLELKRVRLQSLARVLSGRGNLSLTFGKIPCTDMKNITLVPFEKEIEKGVPASKAECWLSQKATCAHEAGHIRFTSKGVWERAVRHSRQMTTLLNIVEDSRIERCMANAFPGTLMWFRFSNDYITTHRENWGTGPRALFGGLISYALVGTIPEPIQEQEKVANLIEKCAPYLNAGRVEKDTEGAYGCALKIWDVIKDFIGAYTPPESLPRTLGAKSPEKAPDGELDPRREPKIYPPKKEDLKPDKPLKEGDKPSPAEKEKPAEFKESEKSSESETKDLAESKEKKSKETAEPEKTKSESDPDGDGEAGEPKPETPDESPDESEEMDDFPGEPEEMDDSGYPDEPEETDDSEPPEESTDYPEPPDDSFDDSGFPDGTTDTEGFPDDSDPGDEYSGETEGFKASEGDESGEADFPEGSGVPGGASKDYGEPGDPSDDIDMDDYKGLLEDVEDELAKLEEAASRAKRSEPAESSGISEEEITGELSKGIHNGCVFIQQNLRSDRETRVSYEAMYGNIKGYINKTVGEIRKILEYKATLKERNLRKGNLDSGSLWKLQVRDTRVFCKVREPNDIPRLAIYLLVDCSGSMRSSKRIEYARESACLLYEVCSQLKIPVNVTGFTGAVSGSGRDITHLRAIDFNEKPDKKYAISRLNASLENRDGYSIRVAKKELLLRGEPQKVLMVLSDGMPCMPYKLYSSKVGEKDTALAVREAEKSGIGVIGLFFGNSSEVPRAQKIYNNLIYVKDVSVLPLAVARVLKKTIERLG